MPSTTTLPGIPSSSCDGNRGSVDLVWNPKPVETREWKRVAIEAVMPSEPKKFQRRKVGKIFSISLSQGSVCYSMIDK